VLANATAFPVAYAYVARGLAGVAADMRLDPVDRVGMVRPEAGGDAITVR
jgi:hypothetical protein